MSNPTPPGPIVYGEPLTSGAEYTSVGDNYRRLVEEAARPKAIPGVTPAEGDIDFAAMADRADARLATGETDTDAKSARQAALEAKYGAGETFATQSARGLLDAVLSPGALVGLAARSYGALWGKLPGFGRAGALAEQFGRDLGRASTGKSALEAGAALSEVFGGVEKQVDAADAMVKRVQEQQEARPLLSAVSQMAGAAVAGLATGGLAASGSGAPTAAGRFLLGEAASANTLGAGAAIGIGAAEGVAGGAQAAYDANAAAPLEDVWASAAIGGMLGAAIPATAIGAARGARAVTGKLADVFGESDLLGKFADRRVAKAIGIRKKHANKFGPEEMDRVARDVATTKLDDGTAVFPETVMDAARMDTEDLLSNMAKAREEATQKLASFRARASAFIDQSAPELRPRPADLADRLEREIATPLESSISPGSRTQAREVRRLAANLRQLGDEVSLEELTAQRIALDPDIRFNAKAPDAMRDARRMIEGDIEARMALASERMGADAVYKPLKRQFQSMHRALEIAGESQGEEFNRWLSLSDNLVGMGTLAGDGVSAVKGLGAAIGHKLLREKGSGIAAVLARKFARTPVEIDVSVAGGREAQEALTEMARARAFIDNTAREASENPNVQTVAQNTIREAAEAELAKRAGPYDVANWATADRAPKPLARLVYRPALLDQMSEDLAPRVQQAAELRPSLAFEMDPKTVGKLVKDGDGTQAIGSLQARVQELANWAETGERAGVAAGDPSSFRVALAELETASPAEAFAIGHRVARQLAEVGESVDSRSLQLELSQEHWGEAGRLYRQMTAAPDQEFSALADPAALREAMVALELRGQLANRVTAAHKQAAEAFQAHKRFTGAGVPEETRRAMRDTEALFTRAEENLTLDGARQSRVIDALNRAQEGKLDVPDVPPTEQVAETVQRAISKLSLVTGSSARSVVGRTVTALSVPERMDRYEERFEQLSDALIATSSGNVERTTKALAGAPEPMRDILATALQARLQRLAQDLPKPTQGKAAKSEALSANDLRLAEAMWSATFEPLSVLEDFARGDLDPDKAAYAWVQYPGLQIAVQAGILDFMNSQKNADKVPENIVGQLDYVIGFNGKLQSTLDRGFAARFTAMGEAAKQRQQAPAPPQRMLKLPSKSTYTERIARR